MNVVELSIIWAVQPCSRTALAPSLFMSAEDGGQSKGSE